MAIWYVICRLQVIMMQLKKYVPEFFSVAVLLVFCCLQGLAQNSRSNRLEFNGPLPNWKNIKSFGATGDGRTDDTKAFQLALNELKNCLSNSWNVLYIPAGNYRITQTLQTSRTAHIQFLNAAIIGEDPLKTKLIYEGADSSTILHFEGGYGRINRLGFETSRKGITAIFKAGIFSSYVEYADLLFKDCYRGIVLGYGLHDPGQAEQTIERCRFYNCTGPAITTGTFNSLDVWVWDSYFEKCKYALFDHAGNIHGYNNRFKGSTFADFHAENLQFFSLVNNISVGSRAFIDFGMFWEWGALYLIQKNKIYGYTAPNAINLGGNNSVLMFDNLIRSPTGAAGNPVVQAPFGTNLLMGNIFTQPQQLKSNDKALNLQAKTVAASTLATPDIQPIDFLPYRKRRIFTMPQNSGNDAAALQACIDSAAQLPLGQAPVVYIPKGNYHIGQTIVIPPMKDIQLVGDGGLVYAGSSLIYIGATGLPLLHFKAPTKASLQEIGIKVFDDKFNGIAILLDDNDLAGGNIYTTQLYVEGRKEKGRESKSAVRIDGSINTDITLQGCMLTGHPNAVLVIGAGQKTLTDAARIKVLGGDILESENLYSVKNNGKLLVQTTWYEGMFQAGSNRILTLDNTTSGKLSFINGNIAPDHVDSATAFVIDGFKGQFTLANQTLSQVKGLAAPPPANVRNGGKASVLWYGNQYFINNRDAGGKLVSNATIWRKPSNAAGELFFTSNTAITNDSFLLSRPALYGQFDTELNAPAATTFRQSQRADPLPGILTKHFAHCRSLEITMYNMRHDATTQFWLNRVHIYTGYGQDAVVIKRVR